MPQPSQLITADASLRRALQALDALSGGVLTLLVTDGAGRLLGTLTDGDVRRALLRGVALDDPVDAAMHTAPRTLRAGHIDHRLLRDYRRQGLRLIPVVRDDGTVERLIDTHVTTSVLPLRAILMAGGRGERLRPLTLDTPKPLLNVGGKPIIDYNVEALAAVGITDITVTVNYLGHMLEEHFATPVAGVSVKCVREDRPLGTIGACSLISHPADGDTLVMNSDLLTTVSLEDLYLTHRREKAAATMSAVPYNVSVPYAILQTEGQRVTALSEKPSYSWYANAGIYIFSNELLRSLPSDAPTDAPDLIERAIADGLTVACAPLTGTWIDIGSPADYRHACELMQLRF